MYPIYILNDYIPIIPIRHTDFLMTFPEKSSLIVICGLIMVFLRKCLSPLNIPM